SVSEVDRPIRPNVQIISTTKRHAICLSGQDGYYTVAIDRQKPFDRVGYDQVSNRVKRESQRPAARVREDFRLRSISLQPHDASVIESGIDATFNIECDIFRTEAGARLGSPGT